MWTLHSVMVLLLCVYHSLSLETILIQSNEEKHCDTTYGKFGGMPCEYGHIRATHDIVGNLTNVLADLDNNNLLRRIYIDVHVHDKTTSTQEVGRHLDAFLTSRPWWMVISEGIQARDENHHRFVYHIYLLRYAQNLEPALRLFAEVQFPTQSQCAITPLRVLHFIGKGWGSQMMLMETRISEYDKIINIWDSEGNDPDEATPYTSKGLCPGTINKRDCAYLPLTNCSTPNIISNARGVQELRSAFQSDLARFPTATADSKPFDEHSQKWNGPPEMKALMEKYHRSIDSSHKILRSPIFIDALGHKINNNNNINQPAAYGTILIGTVLFRMNFVYRRLVHEVVSNFRSNYSFPLNSECTSIHIRRGDRAMENVKEYCSSYRRFDKNGTCINIKDPTDNCGIHQYDIGCFGVHPYATLLLTDYLSSVALLTNAKQAADQPDSFETRTVFIMTDDGAWLSSQMANLSRTQFRNWRVLAMPARFDGHSSKEASARHKNHETDSGVEFLASLALARTCSSFVGHFGSGLTVGIGHHLCVQHGAVTTGQCPSIYDIGYAYHEDGHQVWLPPMTIK